MSLYDAVKLASKQPAQVSPDNARLGNEYYIFGAPGSAACAAAAKANGTKPVPGVHCLLSGPDDNRSDLLSGLPAGVSASEGQELVVPPGTVVLQAADASSSNQTPFDSPTAQFYVLKDHVSLFGNEITNPQQSTDQSGAPDVQFGFTGKGGTAFHDVTRTIARRGEFDSVGSQPLNQHFAIALDNKLITVPQIDFRQYPDGILGDQGADITGGFTIQSAQDLATELRLGALPINLKLISESTVSATLGQQALHQGLIAGLAGLLIVVIFLLVYYRILGVIATAGLIVYGIYFYALIKLIPITLTLPGIAGLILTIGVAADANIVIFERVKEEIRAGRSIRQGIITGYRKGLTAIVDANVVTIMTAFILFVLATADVKGFAFTLGIGTIVSLFTAVMATQAILMTIGRLADDLAAIGTRRRRQEAHVDVRLHGRLAVLLHDVRDHPPDRRAGHRRQGAEPRHRLHLRRARDGGAGQAGHAEPGGRRAGLPGCEQPRGAEGGWGLGAGPERLPDVGEVDSAPQGPDGPTEQVRYRQGRDGVQLPINRPDVRKDDRQQRASSRSSPPCW